MAHFLISLWLPLMMNAALQSVLAPTAVAFALLLMRRISAARRHLLLIVALGSLLLLPPASLLFRARSITPPLSVKAAQPQPIPSVSTPPVALPSPPISQPTTTAPPEARPGGQPVTASAAPSRPFFSLYFLAAGLFALWMAGSLCVLARLFTGLRRLNHVARHCHKSLPEPLQTRIAGLLTEVGTKRPITVLFSAANVSISVPMTWGAWSPILLLPAHVADWPEERRRVVMRHELAHIQRGDWLTQTLAQIVCALYWFNPLVWLTARQLRLEAERACDDAVLSSGMVAAPDYAAHLLAVVRLVQTRRVWPAAVTMARSSQVGDRMKSILDPRRSRRAATRAWWALACLAMCALVLPVTILHPLTPAAADASTPSVSVPVSPSGSQVTLPGGITVELVGVGSSPTGDGEDWWSLDGTPLPEAPQDGNNRFHDMRMGLGTQYLRRALFFRLHAGQATDASTTGYVVDSTKHLQTDGYHYGRDLRLNEAALLPGQPATGVVLLGFPPSEKIITYRFGIAAGPWQTVAVTKNTLHPALADIQRSPDGEFYGPSISLTEKPDVGYWGKKDKIGHGHTLSLLGGHAPLGDVARRVLAFDKNGKIVPSQEGGGGYDGEGSLQISVEDLNRVAEFRLQTRPYQWAEFTDIALQPHAVNGAAPPTPIAMPPARPGFQKTLPSGITVALNALTERGGRWWQPNGVLLPGPIKGQDPSFGGWPPQTHPKAFTLTLSSPRNIEYSEAFQFLVGTTPTGPKFDSIFLHHLMKGQLSPGGMIEEFPAGASTCTMRFGAATAPWQTVAVQKVHFTPDALRRRKIAPDKDFEGDVTLELSAQPKMTYKDAQGKTHTQAFLSRLLGDGLARRFIAVDDHGVATPLQITGEGRDVDIIGLKFEGYYVAQSYSNRTVDLAHVREFRLQTRPYQWAEFPNIALKPHDPRTP